MNVEQLILQASHGLILHAIYEVVSFIMVFFKGVDASFVCMNNGIIIHCILRVVYRNKVTVPYSYSWSVGSKCFISVVS